MLKIQNIYIDHSKTLENKYNVTENNKPTISWSLESDKKGSSQKSFSLKVFKAEEKVPSFEAECTTDVQSYTPESDLVSEGIPYRIELSVTDIYGETSPAKATRIISGKVEKWNAKWICTPECIHEKGLSFTHSFSLNKAPQYITLYCCGIGYQHIKINGNDFNYGILDPAHSNYAKTCYYTVTSIPKNMLNRGKNIIEIDIADGWRYNQTTIFQTIFNGERTIEFYGQPMLTAFIRIQYHDGSVETISTDENWTWSENAIRFVTLFKGETLDASYLPKNCSKQAKSLPVEICSGPGGKLLPMNIPPIDIVENYEPIDVFYLKEGVFVYDFGQNMAGYCKVTIKSRMKKGWKLILRHSEMLGENGEIFTEPLRDACQTDTYIACGKECKNSNEFVVWTPTFTYHGFRYVELSTVDEKGNPVSINFEIQAQAFLTDIVKKGTTFRCGSALATKIHDICFMTERANIHSIFTDCPQRDERMGWMNDATVRFESTPYSFDIGAMFPKIIRDISNEQREDGAFTCCAPFIYGAYPADAVCSSFLVAGNMSYEHNGNLGVIEKNFDNFAAWESSLLKRSDGYIVNYSHYGDWAGPSYACMSDEFAVSAITPGIFMSTGYSYYNCVLLEKFAKLLCRDDDALKYAQLKECIKNAMLEKWFDPETGKMASGSEACQAFSLWLGIIPKEYEQKVADVIHNDLIEREYMFTTGNLCTRYMLEMLAKFGYVNDAWKIITSEKYPGYGYMIQNEATTVWERFELKKNPSMNSHNHPMYASVDYWFFTCLCGIKPLEPGFKKISIKPCYPDGLDYAHATVETVSGQISVRWTKRFGTYNLFVTIPIGCSAVIDVNGKDITVDSGSHVFNWDI